LFVVIVATGLTGVAAAAIVMGYFVHGGISARAEPGALEARIARGIRNLAVPADARNARNPIAASPEVLAAGLAHFADHCASCHANDGSGQTKLGRSLYPRAPDMRRLETQELTDGQLFYIIENGVRLTGMPAWGESGSAEGSWHLVHFIRHLPRLSDEEMRRMEALNPRSPQEWRAIEDEDAFLRGEDLAPRAPGSGSHSH
jgi:mono/diheme cytochrome c family protein